jgi:hypothetical protein
VRRATHHYFGRLTLVYEPSEFMLEAFDADELGVEVAP